MKHDPIAPESLNFEDKLKALEALLEGLESGELPLESWVNHYAQGIELLKAAQAQIQAVELQIEKLDLKIDEEASLFDGG